MVIPVSTAEHRALSTGGLPPVEQVAEGIWTLPVPYRPGHLPFTFAYLLDDAEGGLHIVDPGWDTDANFERVVAALTRIGRGGPRPASIIVTHLHADHMGLAARLRTAYGVPVFLHRRDEQAQVAYARWAAEEGLIRTDVEAWGVPVGRRDEVVGYAQGIRRVVVPADVLIDDGDLLPVPGRRLRAVHTPGHTPGHLCLHEEEAGLLFTGDHLLPRATPGIGSAGSFAENPLQLYLSSLQTVLAYDHCQSLPGHEYRYHGIAARAEAIAGRHLGRMAEVEAVLQTRPEATVWDVASRLSWATGWEALTRHKLVAALRQTAMQTEMVRSGAHPAAQEAWARTA